jgi:hypothetical protein
MSHDERSKAAEDIASMLPAYGATRFEWLDAA